ncbi:hypothetical protein [Burkholderia sp. L27(2015)]|uniref:hypothetical protein n=1 Tax=Burkholderia sp. L27(2015) TaxID=1641858 RepID=UPI00131E80E3|nr:hypothetical protein [Burkholderia sp. L27(2015)]
MKIFEMPRWAPLDPTLEIPAADSRNIRYDMECPKEPTDSKQGQSGVYSGLKGNFVYHSQTEYIALHFLDFNSNVAVIRTQYPFYDEAEFARRYTSRASIPPNFAPTIDIDVGVVLPGRRDLHQHGVSCKETESDFEKKDAKARAGRELAFYTRIRGTWESVVKAYFPETELGNYMFIKRNILHTDIHEVQGAAFSVAETLKKSKARGTLRDKVNRVARRSAISPDHAFRLICVAIYLGHLRIDHRYSFEMDSPFQLASGNVYLFANEPESLPWGFEDE